MADLFINSRLTIADSEMTILSARSSGPGGQNVNKVNSKVTLKWSPARCAALDTGWRRRFIARFGNRINNDGEVVLHSEKFRDRPRNLGDVRQKLVDMLLQSQHAPKKRKATRPTLSSQRRRLDQKKRQSQKKQNRRKNVRDD